MAIGAGEWFHLWSDKAVDSTHSANRLEIALSGVDPSRTVGEGRSASSFLARGFVEKDLLLFRADLVSAAFVWLSSDPGGCFLTNFVLHKSWVPDPGSHSMPTLTTRSLGLLLSSNLGGSCLTIFVVSKSWVPDFVIHSVSSQSPTAVYLEPFSNGSDSGFPDSFEGFNEGRVLGSHRRVRTLVTVISRLDGVQTTPKIGRLEMTLDFELWLLLGSYSFRGIISIDLGQGSLKSEVREQVLGPVWVLCYRCWAYLPERMLRQFSSKFFGARRKPALRGETYAWAPVLGVFDKLREVGVSPYLSFTLYLSVFQCFD